MEQQRFTYKMISYILLQKIQGQNHIENVKSTCIWHDFEVLTPGFFTLICITSRNTLWCSVVFRRMTAITMVECTIEHTSVWMFVLMSLTFSNYQLSHHILSKYGINHPLGKDEQYTRKKLLALPLCYFFYFITNDE